MPAAAHAGAEMTREGSRMRAVTRILAALMIVVAAAGVATAKDWKKIRIGVEGA